MKRPILLIAIIISLGGAILIVSTWAQSRGKAPSRTIESAPIERCHCVVIYFDGADTLQMDYEGTGLRQSSTVADNKNVSFKAIHLESWHQADFRDEKYVDGEFSGTVSRSGDDDSGVLIELEFDNRVPFEVRLLGMRQEVEEVPEDGITQKIEIGKHKFRFEGTIFGRYEKQP